MEELEKVKPSKVMISVNGEQREIKYNFSAWAEIEKLYGGVKNFSLIEKDMKEKPFETLPKMIYIGLVNKEGVTETNCLDDYSMAEIEDVVKKLEEALYGSLPKGDGKKKKVKAE